MSKNSAISMDLSLTKNSIFNTQKQDAAIINFNVPIEKSIYITP